MEDVELARRIKRAGLKLGLYSGANLASVRMYRSWNALWEGWTKNLYLGANRSWGMMIYMAAIMFFLYPMPWLALGILLANGQIANLITNYQLPITLLTICLCAIVIWQQYNLRSLGAQISDCSTKYWWLGGLGGALVAAIAIGSAIKTETGWGWTWRGRALQINN